MCCDLTRRVDYCKSCEKVVWDATKGTRRDVGRWCQLSINLRREFWRSVRACKELLLGWKLLPFTCFVCFHFDNRLICQLMSSNRLGSYLNDSYSCDRSRSIRAIVHKIIYRKHDDGIMAPKRPYTIHANWGIIYYFLNNKPSLIRSWSSLVGGFLTNSLPPELLVA